MLGKNLTVITTHINADFDALASMLAVQKLYPGSLIIFPGSQEKNIRNFFIKSMVYLFNMVDIKEIDFANVRKLILVDTRRPDRIGRLSSLLKRSDLKIHIYDHHPEMTNDIKGHYEVIRPTGATVSILTGILRDKGITISSDEATIMCLGIYEDTGSFNFPSTTEEDFIAAAYLLSNGANLNIVSDLIAREISSEQVKLLNDMIYTSTLYNIQGIEIVVTIISTDHYVSDFAFLVQKMLKMENLNAIFAIARMGEKIYVVARSRIAEVDVGLVVTLLGGGGHAFAAAATIKNMTLAQAEHKLLESLYKTVKPKRLAKDLMSSPSITINQDVTCRDANNTLTRYNINALIVAEKTDGKDKLLGYITRQVIEKAIYHSLAHVQVKEYMSTEVATVKPDADIFEIQKKIIENKQRILPVIDKDRLLGVITRTDLLNILVRCSQKTAANSSEFLLREPIQTRTRNVINFMHERLSERILSILKEIGVVAAELGYGSFIVGGFVRDLFLYRANEDFDIVIEGDGIAFAETYAKRVGARINTYKKFGTATVIFPDGFKVDIASARMEYYQFPAALPIVEMSSIRLDLFRRDFTINTLAVQLNPEKFGVLIDFFNAQKDIKEKSVRVLHNLSFVEDPTRVFRAIRFEQRFDFSIGKLTSRLIGNAVKMNFFKRLSGKRVFLELRQILGEENPTPAIIRLNDYSLLGVIHNNIKLNKETVELFNSVKKVLSWYDLLFIEESYTQWVVYFLSLIRSCNKRTSDSICVRFEVPLSLKRVFCKERFEADKCLLWLERNLPVQNSVLYNKLSVFKTELVLYMMASTKLESVKKAISHYFTRLRYTDILITGKDLKAMGLESGPIYREIMQAILDARLNGSLKTLNDELAYARKYVARSQPISTSFNDNFSSCCRNHS